MLEQLKARVLLDKLLERHDINQAYKMVGPEDSWYDTISTVHRSLAEIQQLPHENWELTSHDGLALRGIFYPGTTDKTVIWVHGYTSHAERESAFPGLFYHALGFNVLIPYLRAHGPSQGKYLTFGALEERDVRAWVDKVNARHSQGQILLHGLSMGGGIVLHMSRHEMKNVKCILADAPSVSIPDFFRAVVFDVFKKDKHPEKIYAQVLRRFQKEFSVNTEEFNAFEEVKACRYPLLLTAGSNEEMDASLNKLRENNPMKTTVLILPGCNHGNGMYKQTELYQSAIREFLEENIT